MDTETIRLVLDVSRSGSFAAAARAHGLDPSSVSRTVSQAERELGIRIFQRTTRNFSPTEAGERLLERLGPLLDEFDRTRADIRSEQSQLNGMVRLTASVAYGHTCILPLLEKFREDFPELRLELILTDDKLDLVRERIDIAVRLGPFVEGDVICSKLCGTQYRVCASPAYLARAPALKKPADLTNHAALLFALGGFRTRWMFKRDNKRITEISVEGSFIISNALSLHAAARSGLGPVLLADWLIGDDIEQGRLIDVFPDYDVTATTFETAAWIVYPSRSYVPARVRKTIDFLRMQLGA
ncbi:MAG: LysR family transcriptional regulator [Hyphomicrobiales bacterium]|nr:LysR family transcriptional regulator [Hyphomicrobiales bacterium]